MDIMADHTVIPFHRLDASGQRSASASITIPTTMVTTAHITEATIPITEATIVHIMATVATTGLITVTDRDTTAGVITGDTTDTADTTGMVDTTDMAGMVAITAVAATDQFRNRILPVTVGPIGEAHGPFRDISEPVLDVLISCHVVETTTS